MIFHSYFPFLSLKYDLEISRKPEVVFYATFSRYNDSCWPDARRWLRVMPVFKPGSSFAYSSRGKMLSR